MTNPLLHTHTNRRLLAQFVECRTLDRKVADSNLTRGAVICP